MIGTSKCFMDAKVMKSGLESGQGQVVSGSWGFGLLTSDPGPRTFYFSFSYFHAKQQTC